MFGKKVSTKPQSPLSTKPILPEKDSKRNLFLDNLKIALVSLVIADHAGQAYVSIYTGYVLVESNIPQINNYILGTFFSINNAFFMALFFLISAYFLPASLDRKGTTTYLKDRFVRLGLPTLFFVLFVFPLLGIAISGAPVLQFGHTWFLALLFIFSSLYAVYRFAKPSKNTNMLKLKVPRNLAIFSFAILLTIGLFLTRIVFAPGQWLFFHLFEPARIVAYISMFAVGIIAYQNGWLNDISTRTGKIWGVIAVITLLTTPIVITVFGNGQDLWAMGFNLATLATSAWDAFLCVGLCVSLPVLFRQKFDFKSKILLSDDAFGAYLLHPFVLLLIQGLFLSVAIYPLAKFFIVVTIGILLSFGVSHYVRKIPYLSRII